jgi:hypothetical protein
MAEAPSEENDGGYIAFDLHNPAPVYFQNLDFNLFTVKTDQAGKRHFDRVDYGSEIQVTAPANQDGAYAFNIGTKFPLTGDSVQFRIVLSHLGIPLGMTDLVCPVSALAAKRGAKVLPDRR